MERFPCEPNEDCPVAECPKEDVHHKAWPKRRYRGSVSRAFRELDINKELTCRARHNEIHATQKPPEKPKESEMLVVIQSVGNLARRAS